MVHIEAQSLLEPVSRDAPCGENLEYDPQFGEMERAAKGRPEEQFGETIKPAEDADWGKVWNTAVELLERTKDMRVVGYLARGSLGKNDLPAFRDSLALLLGYVERYWDTLYPPLDAEDDNDPTFRINSLTTLCDRETMLNLLNRTPIVASRAIGNFSLHDIGVAKGDLPQAPDTDSPLEMAHIEAAFMDVELVELQANADAVRDAIAHVEAIEQTVSTHVGVSNAASLDALVDMLQEMRKVLVGQLSRRGAQDPTTETGAVEGDNGGNNGVAGPDSPTFTGEIKSRNDVVRALDKVCDYYERYEPSSPLPMLIRRAKRLVTKNFLEIVRDLTPEAVSQAEAIGGIDSTGDPE